MTGRIIHLSFQLHLVIVNSLGTLKIDKNFEF